MKYSTTKEMGEELKYGSLERGTMDSGGMTKDRVMEEISINMEMSLRGGGLMERPMAIVKAFISMGTDMKELSKTT